MLANISNTDFMAASSASILFLRLIFEVPFLISLPPAAPASLGLLGPKSPNRELWVVFCVTRLHGGRAGSVNKRHPDLLIRVDTTL